jgi:luxR family two component transcriptional regulator
MTGNCSAGDYAVMPGMDGPDLVAECRQHWPDLPVLILTMFDDATIIRRLLAAGAGLLSSLGGGLGVYRVHRTLFYLKKQRIFTITEFLCNFR